MFRFSIYFEKLSLSDNDLREMSDITGHFAFVFEIHKEKQSLH